MWVNLTPVKLYLSFDFVNICVSEHFRETYMSLAFLIFQFPHSPFLLISCSAILNGFEKIKDIYVFGKLVFQNVG